MITYEEAAAMSIPERAEAIQEAVDGRNDMVWSIMQYGCRRCQAVRLIYLGVGVEGPKSLRERGLYIPSPFMGPRCQLCGGETSHVNWNADRVFEPIDAPPGIFYFKVPNKWTKKHLEHMDSSCFCGESVVSPVGKGHE